MDESPLIDHLSPIHTRLDFTAYVRALLRDFRSAPHSWENRDLDSFLEALAAWMKDMDGYYQNQGLALPEQPTWNMFAEILTAARQYE